MSQTLIFSPRISSSPSPSQAPQSSSFNQSNMGRFWTLLSHLQSLAGPTITLLYPLYASVVAIESPSKLDDEQWLAYWILYSFLTLTEMVAEPVLSWIPIWYQTKVLFVAWLVLPQFRGASFVYEKFVRQQLRKHKLMGASRPPLNKVDEELR